MKINLRNISYMALLCALASTHSANAQAVNPSAGEAADQNDAQGDASSGQLQDIVVTARRVEERSQTVPQSVVAFSSQALQRKNISDLSDVARLSPGLTFESYSTGAFANPTIRGTAQSRTDFADQNVSIFFDGLYLQRQYMVDVGIFDLERIEVLKGPQSALYGRSAFAGAINYIPLQPADEVSARATGTIGNYDRRDIYGTVSIPSSDGRFSFRVGGGYSQFDGSIFNPNPNRDRPYQNGSTGRLGGYVKSNGFGAIRVKPIDRLELNFAYYHFESRNELTSQYRLTFTDGTLNCGNQGTGGGFRLFCGELPYREGSVDPRSNGLTVSSDIFRASAMFSITDNLSLNYTFGSVGSQVSSLYNADTDPLVGQTFIFPRQNVFYRLPEGSTISRSHEARLRYSSGSLSMLLGGYRQRQRDVDSFTLVAYPVSNAPLDTLTPSISLALTNKAEARTALDAIFGQVTYRMLDDRLGIDLQARYTWEDKSLRPSPLTTNLFFQQPFRYFTPRASIDYRFSPNHMVYISVAKGVKSGGFNNTVYVDSQRAYAPDKNYTYEIGTKNDFFNRRLRLNAALFFIDWQNIQTGAAVLGVPPGVIAPSLIGNGKGANVRGFEVETQFVVGGGLSLDGSVSYQDARFKKGTISQRAIDLGLCVASTTCPTNGDIGNNQLPRSSKFQAQAGFNFNRRINQDMGFFARGDATYQTKQYMDDLNLSFVPSRTVANASIGVTFNDDHYELQLWSKNLFDEKYISAASVVVAATDSSYAPNPGPRRTIGATLRVKY